jgi:uncharacterized DUF497 family protein
MISLPPLHVIWDLENDPAGNVQHIAEHGVTCGEVEEILAQPLCLDISRSTGRKIAIGQTSAGRGLIVVFDVIRRFKTSHSSALQNQPPCGGYWTEESSCSDLLARGHDQVVGV